MPEPVSSNTTVQAHDPTTAAAAVRGAIDTGIPLVDYGHAHTGLGQPPPQRHRAFVYTGDNITHDVRDLVVHIAAGCPLGRLQAELAKTNQFLPIDADDSLTLGELVSHNVYGPLRAGYGTLRDRLLGLSFVDGEGRLVKVGGRTVKNVAGYDVTKLMVGSLGELGVLTELTLRTATIPSATMIVDVELEEPQQLDDYQTEWLTSDAAPAWAVLLRERDTFRLRVGYHGRSSACHAQLRSLETLSDQMPDVHVAASQEYDFPTEQRERAGVRAWREAATTAMVKVIVPPAATGFACQSLALTTADEPPRHIEAYPFHGCVFVGGAMNARQARRLDEQIMHVIQPAGGFRVWYRRPGDARDIEPFAPQPPDWPLLCEIKRIMDPHAILNPGRYLPGPEREQT
ncbi:MAG: FAD-binding oxidoreductase [Phycisphaeraceae bacterium]